MLETREHEHHADEHEHDVKDLTRGSFWRSHRITQIMFLLLAFSFALHLATFVVIFGVRTIVRDQAQALASEVGQAQNTVFETNIPVKRNVPIKATVPIKKQVNVPVNTIIPIDRTFQLPLNTPFGSYTIPLPIKADIPIQTNVWVDINESVDIDTNVNLDFEVPISVPVKQTSIASYLEKIRQALNDLAKRLS